MYGGPVKIITLFRFLAQKDSKIIVDGGEEYLCLGDGDGEVDDGSCS